MIRQLKARLTERAGIATQQVMLCDLQLVLK
jgi:hypothetical protein